MNFRQRRQQDGNLGSPELRRRPADQGLKNFNATAPRIGSREFRKARATELTNSVARMDAAVDEQTRRQLAEWIAGHYATQYGGAIPLGLFAVCHLGPPYIDHRLSLLETILEHFTPSDAVPEPYDQARPLVRSGAYLYVEIYSDGQLVPVRHDGTVVTP